MTKPRSINLKHTILVSFLLFSLLSPTKNIATSSNNVAMISINEFRDTIFAHCFFYNMFKNIRDFSAAFYIVDSTCISLYNYFTGHNKRKSKWYLHKFCLYAGRKINITKNFYLDLYFSLLKFSADLGLFLIHGGGKLLLIILLVNTIQLYINIRIYKNFYLGFNPIGAIQVCLLHIIATGFRRSLVVFLQSSYIINRQVNQR